MSGNILYSTFLIIVILVLLSDYQWREKVPYEIVAHRGASYFAPEHTTAAFNSAIEMNADFIELDVQMSKDGHLVVIHDISVDRTTNGTGYVKDLRLRQLKKLDAGSWFDPKFKNERILTLEEVLDLYGNKINFLIEIKNPSLYPGIENKLATVVKKYTAKGVSPSSFIIQSFSAKSIKRVKMLLPSVSTGLLVSIHSSISKYQIEQWSTFVDYLNPHYLIVNRPLVNRVHKAGLKLFPWVVNDKETALSMNQFQVDGIITNNPLLLEGALNNAPSLSTILNYFSNEKGEQSQLNAILLWCKKINVTEVMDVIQALVDGLHSKIK